MSGRRGGELRLRRGLLLVAAAAAASAVLAGLARLGIETGWGARQASAHGPLFVVGMFLTVIALERAVALARPWAYAAPLAGAATALALLAGAPWAAWAAVAASAALLLVNAAIVHRQAADFTWLMLAGAAVLLAGSLAWARGRPVFAVAPAWIAFFVLTIAAERLELSRLTWVPAWARWALLGLAALLAATAIAAALGREAARPFGVALAGVGAWQLAFDIARQTLFRPGLPRYVATGVLLGAAWLVAAGLLFAALPIPPVGPLYDAALHAVLIGYVLSMVFAHMPIILPAVARVAVPYAPLLYLPLAGLLLRVAGDLALSAPLRQAGSLGNALALLLFALVATSLARRRPAAPRPGP